MSYHEEFEGIKAVEARLLAELMQIKAQGKKEEETRNLLDVFLEGTSMSLLRGQLQSYSNCWSTVGHVNGTFHLSRIKGVCDTFALSVM